VRTILVYNAAMDWFASHTYVATWVSLAISLLLTLFKKNLVPARTVFKKT
jgi:hypothetical protein